MKGVGGLAGHTSCSGRAVMPDRPSQGGREGQAWVGWKPAATQKDTSRKSPRNLTKGAGGDRDPS